MGFPFNKYPLGLLGLLDAKVRGRTPNILTDETQAGIDLVPFLLEQNAESLNDLTAVPGAVGRFFGTNATLTVPDQQLWWVHNFSCRPDGVLAAGTTQAVRCVHETSLAAGVLTVNLLVRSDEAVGTAGVQPFTGTASPFLMGPGDRLGVFISTLVLGTARAVQLYAKISRLTI